jgi:hypothetical protein
MAERYSRRWWQRTATGAALTVAFAGAVSVTAVEAADRGDRAPVARAVLKELAGDKKGAFWVILDRKADLSGAATLKDKKAKGAFVYDALTHEAASSQGGLRQLLTQEKAAFTPFWITNAIRVVGDRDLVDQVAARPEVARIEAEQAPAPQQSPLTSKVARSAAPTESDDGIEWNIKQVGADKAWNDFKVRGEGIVVATDDLGVQFKHPALVSNYRGLRSNGTFDHNYNWVSNNIDCSYFPCDVNGHGSNVTGIAVGDDKAANRHIGVAPGARWIAAGNFQSEALRLKAGQWMLAPTDLLGNNPRPDLAPDVVNNSWTNTTKPSSFYSDVIDAWISAGIFPVFSSGNKAKDGNCGSAEWPASLSNAYSVANTTRTGEVNLSSGRGSGDGELKPDIAAPGTDILSASSPADYAKDTGTSQAAPHVAGAVALLWSYAPQLQGDVAATRKILDESAKDIDDTKCGGTAADNNVAGQGFLDIPAALRLAPHDGLGGLTGQLRASGSAKAVADATVTLVGPRNKDLLSDASGDFELERMLPGTYSYRIDAFGYRTSTGSVEVKKGSPTALNTTLEALPSATLRGTVRSSEGVVSGATVTVPNTSAQVRTDETGHYQISLPVGEQKLLVQSPSRCAQPVNQDVTVASDSTLDVDLPPLTDGGYGYTCTAPIVGYQAGTTKLDLTGSKGTSSQVELPFPVSVFGERSSTAWISTDGVVAFSGPPTPISSDLLQAPIQLKSNQVIYPFWSLLGVDSQAGIYTATSPDQIVIEWRNVQVLAPGSRESVGRISVSLLIRPDGTYTFNYRDVAAGLLPAGRNAFIGLVSKTGADSFIYSAFEEAVSAGSGFTVHSPKTP